MQEALPYKTWHLPAAGAPPLRRNEPVGRVVAENAASVVAVRGCCMGHVVRRLLLSLGANPAFYEVDGGEEEGVVGELREAVAGDGGGGPVQFPAVFIGGRFFGGLDRVMAAHITGELTPALKRAGALWL